MSVSKLLGLVSKPNITVEPSIDANPPLYLLYPSATEPGSQAPKFTTITGRFKVSLKKPETFVEIYATLTPNFFVRNKRCKDVGSLPSYACKIQQPASQLESGVHDFPFVFTLPCTAWPRCSILNEYTSTSHSIKDASSFNVWYTLELVIVKQQADGSLSKFTAEFPQRKKGLLLDGDIDEWRDIYHNRFFALIASPVDPGELPPPLMQVIEEYAPQLGPITVVMTGRTLTPGSLITFNIELPDVPPNTTWRKIQASVHQTFTWRSLNAGGPTFSEGPFVFPFMLLKPPFGGQGKNSVSIVQSARLPDDRFLAPTTLKHTITPNHASHQIVLEFEIIDGERLQHRIALRASVTLASCMLIPEWLNVPEYGASPPPTRSDFQPERARDAYSCECGFSIHQLMEREEAGLLPPEEYEPPPIKKREE